MLADRVCVCVCVWVDVTVYMYISLTVCLFFCLFEICRIQQGVFAIRRILSSKQYRVAEYCLQTIAYLVKNGAPTIQAAIGSNFFLMELLRLIKKYHSKTSVALTSGEDRQKEKLLLQHMLELITEWFVKYDKPNLRVQYGNYVSAYYELVQEKIIVPNHVANVKSAARDAKEARGEDSTSSLDGLGGGAGNSKLRISPKSNTTSVSFASTPGSSVAGGQGVNTNNNMLSTQSGDAGDNVSPLPSPSSGGGAVLGGIADRGSRGSGKGNGNGQSNGIGRVMDFDDAGGLGGDNNMNDYVDDDVYNAANYEVNDMGKPSFEPFLESDYNNERSRPSPSKQPGFSIDMNNNNNSGMFTDRSNNGGNGMLTDRSNMSASFYNNTYIDPNSMYIPSNNGGMLNRVPATQQQQGQQGQPRSLPPKPSLDMNNLSSNNFNNNSMYKTKIQLVYLQ
jgi:hypothetical protein